MPSSNPNTSAMATPDPPNFPQPLENMFTHNSSTNQPHPSHMAPQTLSNSSLAFAEGSSHLTLANSGISHGWPENQTKLSQSDLTSIPPSLLNPSLIPPTFQLTSPVHPTQSFMPMLPSNPPISSNPDASFSFQTYPNKNWDPSSSLPLNLSHFFQTPSAVPTNSNYSSQNSEKNSELSKKNSLTTASKDLPNDFHLSNVYSTSEEKQASIPFPNSTSSGQTTDVVQAPQVPDPLARPPFHPNTNNPTLRLNTVKNTTAPSTINSVSSTSTPNAPFLTPNLRSPGSAELPSDLNMSTSHLSQAIIHEQQPQSTHLHQPHSSSTFQHPYLQPSNTSKYNITMENNPNMSFGSQIPSINYPKNSFTTQTAKPVTFSTDSSSFPNPTTGNAPINFIPVQNSTFVSETKKELRENLETTLSLDNSSATLPKSSSFSTNSSISNASISGFLASSTPSAPESASKPTHTISPYFPTYFEPLQTPSEKGQSSTHILPSQGNYPFPRSEPPNASTITEPPLSSRPSQETHNAMYGILASTSLAPNSADLPTTTSLTSPSSSVPTYLQKSPHGLIHH
ncbi:hypothetical protein HMI54_011664 [Coelomomyces lativittatus]|nr:hypothetical protein HMI54_011664 [Coelomomyces lativittatus]